MGSGERSPSAPLASRNPPFRPAMSQHPSLQGSSGIVLKRNVLKRFERVEILRKRGQWKTGDRVMGLRKTKPDV
jgi:small basic protein (TIGR04137 family)